MISDWMRVGEKAKNNKGIERSIGFPVYSNMVLIADLLDVDVGYLTGETDMETFTAEKTCEYLNLSEDAIKAILNITGTEKTCLGFGYESEKYKGILNKVFTSPEFIKCIETIGELEYFFAQKEEANRAFEKLLQELGAEKKEIAFKYADVPIIEDELDNLTEDEVRAIAAVNEKIDEQFSLSEVMEYKLKVCKYEIQELIILLINRLYPCQ